MTILYWIILIAFIVTIAFLIRSIFLKYNEKSILTKVSEKITDGYLIFSSNGKITNFNKAILDIFNFNENDLKNKNIYEIFNEKEFGEEYIKKILNACKTIKNSNEPMRFEIRKDDKILRIEIKSIVNNDIFLRYAMICKDVTNTYKFIEELQNSQDMMANREKFAILGQLISRNCSFFKNSNFCYIRRVGSYK